MLADIFAEELFAQAFERAVFLQFLHCAVDFFQRGFVAFVYDQACAEFFGIGCAPVRRLRRRLSVFSWEVLYSGLKLQ